MKYSFFAYGHPNIRGTHKTTFEFTKDQEVSLKGDCIIGVNADFDLAKLKEVSKKCSEIKIDIEACGILDTIFATINKDFKDSKEMVVRKTEFISPRTFALKASKSASEIERELIECLNHKKTKIRITLSNTNDIGLNN